MGLEDNMNNAGIALRLELDKMKVQEHAQREAAKAKDKEKALRHQAEAAKYQNGPGNLI